MWPLRAENGPSLRAMGRVSESELPGVGARFDFTTDNGEQLGVVVHRTGRRDVAFYDKDDPDACRAMVHLEEHEARDLAEMVNAGRADLI